MTLDDLLVKISTTEVEDSKLYFITRILRDGVRKSSRVMDKYLFKAYQIDIDDDIREYLYTTTEETLKYIINKQFEIIDYDTDHNCPTDIDGKMVPIINDLINQEVIFFVSMI